MLGKAAMGDRSQYPDIIQQVGFDFSWDERKVWALDLPVQTIPLADLEWHFHIPFLWHGGGQYNLTPQAVIEDPADYRQEYDRTLHADLDYPIDIMENKGRWLILDGLHRLMKASLLGHDAVRVRKVPRRLIPMILAEPEAESGADSVSKQRS